MPFPPHPPVIKRVGFRDFPPYFYETWRRYGLAVAFAWVREAVARDWQRGELFAGFIAYDQNSYEVGRGWTPARAARKAGWSQVP